MIIGFDGKRAVNNMTGLGNYSRLVIEEVGKRFRHLRNLHDDSEAGYNSPKRDISKKENKKESGEDWRVMIYTPEMKRNSRLEPIRRLDNVEFRFPPAQGFKGAAWRTIGITNSLKADGCSIYHGLSNELPLNISSSGIKSIVTIHDLIYRRLPSCYSWPDRLLYDFKYGKSCKNADRIIAVSECTKRDIIEYYDISPEKIDVIYQGCADIFRKNISANEIKEARNRLDLPEKYIAQIGTVEERKNLEQTIRALSGIDQDISLVVVGKDHHGYMPKMKKLAAQLGLQNRIKWMEGIDFYDLPIIYNQALVSVYPSRYEGFGIPIIESIESGTPVVAATGSCLEEAGGNGALYVSPDDPQALQSAITNIIGSKELRANLISEGKVHVRKFDNSRMTDRIVEVYEKVLQEPA